MNRGRIGKKTKENRLSIKDWIKVSRTIIYIQLLIIRGVRYLFDYLAGCCSLGCSSESEFLGCNCSKHDYLDYREGIFKL